VRLWSSAANVILTDADGRILDAFYRRPKKGEVSGGSFDPMAAPRKGAERRSAPGAGAARRYEVRELPGPGTFNERLETLYRDIETVGDRERAAADVDAELEMSENKVLANLAKLQRRLQEYADVDRFKELGDLLMSSLHLIHKGDRWLRVTDYYHADSVVEIELAPELSPAQNAESYYERHRKARLGRSKVEEEIAHLEATLARIRRQRALLAEEPDAAVLERAARGAAKARKPLQASDMPGLVFYSPPGGAASASVHGRAAPGGAASASVHGRAAPGGAASASVHGRAASFRIIVGRTASENDELLRRKVRGNDWWFHARDWPGAYVFVKAPPNKSLPLEVMLDAAMLAVHFSKGKGSGQGDVYYTRVKYLRRAKGAKKGTVLPTQEKNLHVKVDAERIEMLKEGGDPEVAAK
jgi:predicted ribosome quality control (RQC) complex YloA/Tae2 family protein